MSGAEATCRCEREGGSARRATQIRQARQLPPPLAERRRRTTMSSRAGEWRAPWSASKVDAISDAKQAIKEDSIE